MTDDNLLQKLRTERAALKGNAGMLFVPVDVAQDHGMDPVEAQQMLGRLEKRGELAVVSQGEMWCFPEDEHRF